MHTVGLAIEDLGWDRDLKRFVDLEEAPISTLFKLYPWEWVLDDEFGRYAAESLPQTMWVEPLWKSLLTAFLFTAIMFVTFDIVFDVIMPKGPLEAAFGY